MKPLKSNQIRKECYYSTCVSSLCSCLLHTKSRLLYYSVVVFQKQFGHVKREFGWRMHHPYFHALLGLLHTKVGCYTIVWYVCMSCKVV